MEDLVTKLNLSSRILIYLSSNTRPLLYRSVLNYAVATQDYNNLLEYIDTNYSGSYKAFLDTYAQIKR